MADPGPGRTTRSGAVKAAAKTQKSTRAAAVPATTPGARPKTTTPAKVAKATPTTAKRSGATAAKGAGAASRGTPAKSERPPRAPRPAVVEPEYEDDFESGFDDDFEDGFDEDLDDERTPEPAPEPATGRVFTPPRPAADDGRPRASSLLADLWLEREEMVRPAGAPKSPKDTSHDGDGGPGFMHGKGALIAAIAAVAVLLGGGLGVFLAKSGSGTPSRATFIAKADAVCGTANASTATVAKPTSYPELGTAMGTVVTATDSELAGLSRLRLPGGADRVPANGAIAALTATDGAAHTLADAAAKKDDAATAAATSKLATQFADASAKAKAFGFTACATGMQTAMANVAGGAQGLVKTTFMAKSDSLCREASRTLDAIPPFKNNATDVARYFGQGVAVVTKLANDLRALPAPPGDEATVADILSAVDKVNAKTSEMKDAAAAGDQSRFVAAGQELTVLETAADAKLDAYGMSVCGSNFGES